MKPKWLQWAYVERTAVGNSEMVRVVVRKWHPGYWLTVLRGWLFGV